MGPLLCSFSPLSSLPSASSVGVHQSYPHPISAFPSSLWLFSLSRSINHSLGCCFLLYRVIDHHSSAFPWLSLLSPSINQAPAATPSLPHDFAHALMWISPPRLGSRPPRVPYTMGSIYATTFNLSYLPRNDQSITQSLPPSAAAASQPAMSSIAAAACSIHSGVCGQSRHVHPVPFLAILQFCSYVFPA
jgi:hypothetical protein